MILLDTLYHEKDEVKSLGARWVPEEKKWAAPSRSEYDKFLPWLYDLSSGFGQINIACDNVYIVEGRQTCFRCHKPTSVIGFAYDCIFEYDVESDGDMLRIATERNTDLNINPPDPNLPKYIMDIAKANFNYGVTYSKTTQSEYLANRCSHCDSLQGDFYLFGEVGSPFFITSAREAKQLTLHKIKLKFDFVMQDGVNWSSEDYLIRKHAKMSNDLAR